MQQFTKEQADKIQERIEKSTLSDDAKFDLTQFLHPVVCGCGHTLVHNGALLCIDTPEGRDQHVKEINESSIATATTKTVNVDSKSGAVTYHLAVTFLTITA